MRIHEKVVILTGAASGIGRSTAMLFAKEGARMIISDINEEGLNETMSLITDGREHVTAMKVDVRNKANVKKMIEKTIQTFGRIDILICNAGVVRVGQVDTFSDEDYDLLIDVNMKGTYYCCKYAIPYLKAQKSGTIINLTSVAAHIGQSNHANYCSTKAAVLGFSKGLALDLAPFGIRVNTVSPGATDTPMLRSDVASQAKDRNLDFETVKKEFEEEGVIGRWATPEEIAAGILFLASDESSYMLGADLRLDGGWTTR